MLDIALLLLLRHGGGVEEEAKKRKMKKFGQTHKGHEYGGEDESLDKLEMALDAAG